MQRSLNRQRNPIDPFEAVRATALKFGVEKLAPLMGRAVGTLYNKINLNESTHHELTLGDFIQINSLTQDFASLEALNYALGHCCFRVPDHSNVSDTALMQLLNKIGAEGGDFYRVLNIALEDKKFSRDDFVRVEREALEFIGAIAETLDRIRGLVDG